MSSKNSSKIPFAVIPVAVYALYAALMAAFAPWGAALWTQLAFGATHTALVMWAIGGDPAKNQEQTFFGYAKATIAGVAAVAQLLFGLAAATLLAGYLVVGVAISAVLLAVSCIALFTAAKTVGHVQDVEREIKERTSFTRDLLLDLQDFRDTADLDNATRKQLDALIEEVRYSDPMSCDAAAEVEDRIRQEAQNLASAQPEQVVQSIGKLTTLIASRNRKVQASK